MVDQALHEYAASLPATGHATRSRRLIKCAKDSGHYPSLSGIGSDYVAYVAVNPLIVNGRGCHVVSPLARAIRLKALW
jgi:hypothetical protein